MNCGVIDWDGLENNEGEPLPYSKDQCHKIMFAPNLQRIRDGALWACNMVADLEAAEQEADVKN